MEKKDTGILGILDEFNEMIEKSFSSIACRVDPELKGNEHYLVVSQEMFAKLTNRQLNLKQ